MLALWALFEIPVIHKRFERCVFHVLARFTGMTRTATFHARERVAMGTCACLVTLVTLHNPNFTRRIGAPLAIRIFGNGRVQAQVPELVEIVSIQNRFQIFQRNDTFAPWDKTWDPIGRYTRGIV